MSPKTAPPFSCLNAKGGTNAIAIEAELEDVAGQYGYGKCKDAAEAMVDVLTKHKQTGSVVTLTWIPYDNKTRYVWSDIANREVAESPIHVGVEYNGNVYCNIHPYGLPEEVWINDFNYLGIKSPPVKVPF